MRAAVAAVLLTAGCVSVPQHVRYVDGTTSTETITETPTVSVTRDKAVPGLPPGAHPGPGEVEKLCPYIAAGKDLQPSTYANVADIVGSHVYRATVLPGLTPVGCRFYFYSADHRPVADIRPRTFATAQDAHDALVLTAQHGSEQIAKPNFLPGVDGVLFRTRFVVGDGPRDWAFAFAKGRVLVVVHTWRSDPASVTAFGLGRAIVGKF